MHQVYAGSPDQFEVLSSYDDIYEFCLNQGWTDGLPIVPPTPERVQATLAWTDRDEHEVVGCIPPQNGEASVGKIAINAVMAGCSPEYFPVLITAVEALTDQSFNLDGVQTTTGPLAPLLLINGPVAQELGINGSTMAFGPGWRGNATIGRAIRLLLVNVGGARPGVLCHSTQGQPGMFSLCAAENEARSPWEPFHVEHACKPAESTVSVFAVMPGHHLYQGHTADDAIVGIAREIGGITHKLINGGEGVLALCPEHAHIFATEGYSKQMVKEAIWEQAGSALSRLTPSAQKLARARREHLFNEGHGEDSWIPIFDRSEQLHIIVVGGDSLHSTFYNCFSQSQCVVRRIANRQGRAVSSVSELRRPS